MDARGMASGSSEVQDEVRLRSAIIGGAQVLRLVGGSAA
jgi:hypothetical protein